MLFNTDLEYLNTPDKFYSETTVSGIIKDSDQPTTIILKSSIFYPKGGGQPSDQGYIKSTDVLFEVEEVKNREGNILHFGKYQTERTLSVGDKVHLEIDKSLRKLHSRIHTAGELICAIMNDYGYGGRLVDGAIHYPSHSSITYNVSLSVEERERIKSKLEVDINLVVKDANEVNLISTNDREKVEELCGYDPDYISPNSPVRIVQIKDKMGRPCQGTHVKNTSEIGQIKLRKIKAKKGKTIISYTIPF